MPIDLSGTYVPGGVLDQLLGVAPPALDTTQEQVPAETLLERVLAAMSPLAATPLRAPRSFGEGFGGGLVRGVGGAGARIAARRAQVESLAAERQRARNAANIRATENYQEQRATGLREAVREQRTRAEKEAEYARENPPVGSPQYSEMLKRIEDKARVTAAGTAAGKPPESEKGMVPDLTPAALDIAAVNWAQTGQLPPGGMGPQGIAFRTKIMNRAGDLFPQANLATNRATFVSNQTALTALTKLQTGAQAFETTALANSRLLLDSMRKIPSTSSPLLNRPMRAWSLKGLGSDEVAAFNTAQRVVVPEFARLLANPTLSGELTDTARREMESVIRGDYNLRQMVAVIGVLAKDAQNRRGAYEQAIESLIGNIGGIGGYKPPGAQPLSDEEAYQRYLKIVGGKK